MSDHETRVCEDIQRGKGHGFIANGQLYLQRCFECGRENWAPAVASGQCAWCGDKPEVADLLHRRALFLILDGGRS